MNNNIKIKVAFDPTEAWNQVFFREFIKGLVLETDDYEVYLVTLSTDNDFIASVVEESGIDANNSSQLTANSAVTARLNTLGCRIYFAEDNVIVNFVNNTIPIQLSTGNVTGCQALVLNNLFDSYKVQQKYITYFQFWVEMINRRYRQDVC